jgi:CPA1 family monovalent cation:H+ antiporter
VRADAGVGRQWQSSLPEVAEKSIILAATCAVVLFTIIVQGLSLRALVERVVK